MQCSNNLKQQGLAVHNYHDTYKTFPPALLGSGRYNNMGYHAANGGVKNTTGWALLLPFIEGDNIADKFDISRERVRQIEVNLLAKMKKYLESEMPDIVDFFDGEKIIVNASD